MILERLTEHYDRIAPQAQLAMPGWSQQRVSFCILLEPDGTLVDFQDVRELNGKKMRAPLMIVPGQSKPSGAGITPCFLWDSSEYLLGFSLDPAKERRAPKTFEAFKEEHLLLEGLINHSEFSAVCAFLRNWRPSETAVPYKTKLTECATNFGIFRVVGEEHFVHQVVKRPPVATDASASMVSMCLVSGKQDTIARLHEPKIKGVTGAQTAGALLVSFNASAFTSYGKDQSFNAPVGETAVFKYANALNYLLATRRKALGDATVTWWADGVALDVETLLEDVFGASVATEDSENLHLLGEKEHIARAEEAKSLLSQTQKGTMLSGQANPDHEATRYFILGLSPNASRLSVRLWIDSPANELLDKLQRHIKDVTLQADRRPPALWNIIAATGRAERESGKFKKFDTTAVSPQLAGDLGRSVLIGTAYPQSLLSTMIRRIRSDGEVHPTRVSAIKAFLNRQQRKLNIEEIPLFLDITSTDAAYRCGRIFAVLEKAQEESAQPEGEPQKKTLNTTIKDRFFGAACARPLLVIPRLMVLNGHHLRKLGVTRPGRRNTFNKLLGEIQSLAPFTFPRQLDLASQGRFIIGYYQQRQDLFTSKKDNSADDSEEEISIE